MKNTSGKTFIIAGASSGIGLELATQLLDQGNIVHAVSRTPGPLEGRSDYFHHVADVLQEHSLPAITGPVHGLAYCPGSITLKPAERLTVNDIDRDFHINAKAAFLFLRQYLPPLRESGNASIVLFSTVAVQTGMPFHASIAMAKGAIEGLTRSLAAELSPLIRVNAIAPSLTYTPLASGLLNTEVKMEAAKQRHPLKSIGSAQEQASLAFFLLTDARWITGQVIGVNGGLGSIVK